MFLDTISPADKNKSQNVRLSCSNFDSQKTRKNREIFNGNRETWRFARKPWASRLNREHWQVWTNGICHFYVLKLKLRLHEQYFPQFCLQSVLQRIKISEKTPKKRCKSDCKASQQNRTDLLCCRSFCNFLSLSALFYSHFSTDRQSTTQITGCSIFFPFLFFLYFDNSHLSVRSIVLLKKRDFAKKKLGGYTTGICNAIFPIISLQIHEKIARVAIFPAILSAICSATHKKLRENP